MFFNFLYEDILVLSYTSTYLANNFKGKGLAYCFLPLESVKITKNWNFHPQTKHVFPLYVTFDVDVCSSNQKKVWLNFRKLTKSFAEPFLRDFLWFQRAFLPGNININTLAVFFSFFISNLTCCICTNKIYISNRFNVICHTSLYCLIPIFLLKCC